MCGIIGYIGHQPVYPLLIEGLKRLEYRGYDSAGVAIHDTDVRIYKCKGKIRNLEDSVSGKDTGGSAGIGHTRWATHGEPNDVNAHPHISEKGRFILVHNGIIENFAVLRAELEERGYSFKTETDTEVLVNLIEFIYLEGNTAAEVAVRHALTKVAGTYGIVVICTDEPGQLIAARRSSPLVIGIGSGEYFIASDTSPLAGHVQSVIYMNDDDVAIVKRNELVLKTIATDEPRIKLHNLDIDTGEFDKGGYDHYMLKEIFEQPASVTNTFRGRLLPASGEIRLGGLFHVMPRLEGARRIIIVACGTSWHAGLIGEYLIEDLARIPVEVEYASEFRYRNPVIGPEDVVIAISQSGETADTLAAVRLAREAGALVIGICNVTGSSLSRETDAGVYTHAGFEIGVASTKAFTAQVTVLIMTALLLGYKRGSLTREQYISYIGELNSIPASIEKILSDNGSFLNLASEFKDFPGFIFLGRGYCFPVALEGALKLKEISYIHAEGYPAAEMKHGPIALMDENMPVVVLALRDKSYDKIISNLQEIKARKARIIAIVNEGDDLAAGIADRVISIPGGSVIFSALLAVVPMQLMAYHIAVMRGCDVDQPRNLAKSVTVE
jgi:glutamine---fructose-6-phosphate transaminase (isomerizing)